VAETPTAEFAILHSGRSTPPGVESASSSVIFSHRAADGQDLPVGRAKWLPQSRRLRLALDCPGPGPDLYTGVCPGRRPDYNIVIVFAEGE
jgi:hypothetical protein